MSMSMKDRKDLVSVRKKLLYAVFLIYICLMIYEVFIGPYRSIGGERKYNLYPFATIAEYLYSGNHFKFKVMFINLIANVITFIPLGLFLPLLFNKPSKFVYSILLYIIIIFLIEVIQFILNVGVFDIDDILLNTSGCIIGYFFYKILRKYSVER